MIIDDICVKKSYIKNGAEKVSWNKIGVLKTADDGKRYIDLFMHPDARIYVFERKKDETETIIEQEPAI